MKEDNLRGLPVLAVGTMPSVSVSAASLFASASSFAATNAVIVLLSCKTHTYKDIMI